MYKLNSYISYLYTYINKNIMKTSLINSFSNLNKDIYIFTLSNKTLRKIKVLNNDIIITYYKSLF